MGTFITVVNGEVTQTKRSLGGKYKIRFAHIFVKSGSIYIKPILYNHLRSILYIS